MQLFLDTVKMTVLVLVRIEMILLFIRAIMSWLPISGDGVAFNMIGAMTEPLLAPVRRLIDRFMPKGGLPIDLSLPLVYILLYITELVLSFF